MIYAPPTPGEQIQFLENFQALLNEGQFTSTYKFALLVALADIAVESGEVGGDPLVITVDRIAKKFVEYYWHHNKPWPAIGRETRSGTLAQNTGGPVAVLKYIHSAHDKVSPYLVDVRRNPAEWNRLLAKITRRVKAMPLQKLQRMRGRLLEFLYTYNTGEEFVTLQPGTAFNLRRFHPLITGMARNAWADFVRTLKGNQKLLGQVTDLHEFLFGTERSTLGDIRPVLRELQKGECFYCARTLSRDAPVDHLVPWSRYRVDLAHNFVLADTSCNAQKSDFLPQLAFLERWVRRNEDNGPTLEAEFSRIRAPHDLIATVQIASWAFGQVERAGGRVWAGGKSYEPLLAGWREVLSAGAR